MNTHAQDRGPAEGLDSFPEELQAALSTIRGRQASGSLIERVTERALALEYANPAERLFTANGGNAKMGASHRGLLYALSVLALTAFLTIGFFAREKMDRQGVATGEPPILSAIVVLPLLQWDQEQFEQDLRRTEAELRRTAEIVRIQAVREEIEQVLAEFKK